MNKTMRGIAVAAIAAVTLTAAPAMADDWSPSPSGFTPAQMAFTFASGRACEHQLNTVRTVGVFHYGEGAARVVFKVRRDGRLRHTVAFRNVEHGEQVSVRPVVRQGRSKSVEVYVDGWFVGSTALRPLDDCPDFS